MNSSTLAAASNSLGAERPAERRHRAAWLSLGVPLLLASAWAAWFFLIPRTFCDDQPLPTGLVQAPTLLDGQDTSEIRVFIRFSIKAFTRIVNKLLPQEHPITTGSAKGKLTRSEIAISPSPSDRSRLAIGGTVTFTGTAPYGPFKIKKATADITGTSLGLDFGPDWTWQSSPDAKAKVTDLDVTWAPDWVGQLIANSFRSWWLPDLLPKNPKLSIRPISNTAWRTANQDISIATTPLPSFLVLRPKNAIASDVHIDERREEISLSVGIDFESAVTVGDTAGIVESPVVTPLPNLTATRPIPDRSHVRIPVIFRVSELSRFWTPQSIASPLGHMVIEKVELSEQDHLLHGRMHFTLRPHRNVPLGTKQLRGLIRFQFRPSCDPRIGQISVNEFSFTERSESLLIDMVGDGANVILRNAFKQTIPLLSDAVMRRVEMELKAQADSFLKQAVHDWASAMPVIQQEILELKPSVTGISVKPIRVEAQGGYLIMALHGEATVALTLD